MQVEGQVGRLERFHTKLIAEVKSRQHMELEEEDGEKDKMLKEIREFRTDLKQKTEPNIELK